MVAGYSVSVAGYCCSITNEEAQVGGTQKLIFNFRDRFAIELDHYGRLGGYHFELGFNYVVAR